MDPNMINSENADINEMIRRRKIEERLEKSNEALFANEHLPLEAGYTLDGQPMMMGIKFKLDHEDLSKCDVSFGYAEGDEFVPIEADVKFTGWSDNNLPLITINMGGDYSGPLEGFSFHNQLLLHVEKGLSQLALMLAHVRSGMAPPSVLKMPTPAELKNSGVVVPGQ